MQACPKPVLYLEQLSSCFWLLFIYWIEPTKTINSNKTLFQVAGVLEPRDHKVANTEIGTRKVCIVPDHVIPRN